MGNANFAHLKPDSIFYPLFPNGLCPIKNILMPRRAEMIGDGVQDFYDVDVGKLSRTQRIQIAKIVAQQCGGTPEQVEWDMVQRGMIPLRAKHVSGTSTNVPFFI